MAMSQKKQLAVSLLVALLVAVGLGTYAWLGVFEPGKEEAARKETEAKLFALDTAEVDHLEVRAKGETTLLARKEDGWRITSPVDAAADAAAVDGLLDRLSKSNRKKLLEEKDGDPTLFGLNEPSLVIMATTAAGEKAELILGTQNTFDSSYFASIRKGEIISVDGWLKGSLEKTTFDLRKKELLSFADDTVERIAVQGSAPYAVARNTEGWELQGPAPEPADEAAVDKLLRSLRDAKATAFPAGGPESFGLDQPALVVTLERKELPALTLRLGSAEGKHFAQAADGPIAEVAAQLVEDLSKAPPAKVKEEPPAVPPAAGVEQAADDAGEEAP